MKLKVGHFGFKLDSSVEMFCEYLLSTTSETFQVGLLVVLGLKAL